MRRRCVELGRTVSLRAEYRMESSRVFSLFVSVRPGLTLLRQASSSYLTLKFWDYRHEPRDLALTSSFPLGLPVTPLTSAAAQGLLRLQGVAKKP